ncbi:MAG TPA: hypothetical protein VGP22_16920 [Albitalea sp.]|jgi:hypothetical protein|nr:hypothetical protein [Albitalea sp.]
MANRLLSFAVLALATGTLLALRRQSQQRHDHDRPAAKPVPEQRWEGEGGALPATGAQMGPDPVITNVPEEAPAGSSSTGIH